MMSLNPQFVQGNPANFRTGMNKPKAVVVHIAEGTYLGTMAWFKDPNCPALAHFVVGKEENQIVQMCRMADACWHAGWNRGIWKLYTPGISPNFQSIGIENAGKTGDKLTDWQYRANAWIISEVSKKFDFPINLDTVVGHYQMDQVNRKNCPGVGVDFKRLVDMAIAMKQGRA